MNKQFYNLKIKSIEPETAKAKYIIFDINTDLKKKFKFTAGQFVTLNITLNSKKYQRCYSLVNSPFSDEELGIVVKIMKGTNVSKYINESIKKRDELEVSLPHGNFSLVPNKNNKINYCFLSTQCNIVSLYSIIHTILLKEPSSKIYILHGDSSEETIVFKSRLNNLKKQFTERVVVEYILQNPSVWSELQPKFIGKIGGHFVDQFLNEFEIDDKSKFYCCIPEVFNPILNMVFEKRVINPNKIFNLRYDKIPD